VIDGYVFINGKQLELPDRAKPQFDYTIYGQKGVSAKNLLEVGAIDFMRIYQTTSKTINEAQINILNKYAKGFNRNNEDFIQIYTSGAGLSIDILRKARLSAKEITGRDRVAPLTDEMAQKLRNNPKIDSVVRNILPKGQRGGNIFPQDANFPWNYSQLGKIYIPEAGKTIALNLSVLPLYKKILEKYEGNTIKVTGNQISLNGKVVDSYTFKQDYYWMMGDNRDHSEDSRAWGYVPENHIVGTPIFIWMSFDNFVDAKGNMNWPWKWKPRWDRIFTTVNGTGEPVSYFKYFLIALAGWFAFDFIKKKRKENNK